jgi:Tfp pilus assembly protein PilE
MRELLILALIAAAAYLAYDDYYKQRPALQQAQAEIQQLRQTPAHVDARVPTYTPRDKPAPAWFQQHLNESSSTLDTSRQHTQKDERASTPRP